MNEIEKLYKNVGIIPRWVERYERCNFGTYEEVEHYYDSYNEMIKSMMEVNDWSKATAVEVAKKECKKELPEFTDIKQFKLIKWLIIEGYIESMLTVQISEENFEGCLADTFNELWQDLTEEEKEQVKGILNE